MFSRNISKKITILTLIMFVISTFAVHAQDAYSVSSKFQTQSQAGSQIDLSSLPHVNTLSHNLTSIERALAQIDDVARPLYNQVAPSNMDTMNISQRIKAILGNAKSTLDGGVQNYKSQVGQWNAANGVTPDMTFEGELGLGLNKLGIESGKMPMDGAGNVAVSKLKSIIDAIKSTLQRIISVIRAKIASVAQKVGLMKKDDSNSSLSKGKQVKKDTEGYMMMEAETPQYADNFSGKLSKGLDEGVANAGQSLKNSFSLSNLAVTTTVAVGTNLALQMINGQRPSLQQAARQVATIEFAGSVVGGALGAAGGQVVSSVVKTFIPGPIGAMVGAFIPVFTSMGGSQIGASLGADAKGNRFDLVKAIKSVDYIDLAGSSIGSTIGMAIGAPIPILGPIIGGIVGGIIGGKVAKWISDVVFHRGSMVGTGNSFINENPQAISIGQGQNLGIYGPGTWQGGMTPVSTDIPRGTTPVIGTLRDAERKYYETYLNYNRLVEQGDQAGAKKMQADLQKATDNYNTLKNQAKTTESK
ncbi:MAG: hypothetical protein HQM10_07325 [Candidatus Riflebacteria bacterium]|nr:hypothetical protein [Candidatus Riflebacteria bacterium]